MEKGTNHHVFLLFSSVCEYGAPGSTVRAGNVFWTKSPIYLLDLYVVLWISKYALRLLARRMPLAFIWKWQIKNNNNTLFFVLPGWVNGSLLKVVQHQACWIQLCYSLCDAASEVFSWSMGRYRNSCEVVACLALSRWMVKTFTSLLTCLAARDLETLQKLTSFYIDVSTNVVLNGCIN